MLCFCLYTIWMLVSSQIPISFSITQFSRGIAESTITERAGSVGDGLKVALLGEVGSHFSPCDKNAHIAGSRVVSNSGQRQQVCPADLSVSGSLIREAQHGIWVVQQDTEQSHRGSRRGWHWAVKAGVERKKVWFSHSRGVSCLRRKTHMWLHLYLSKGLSDLGQVMQLLRVSIYLFIIGLLILQ